MKNYYIITAASLLLIVLAISTGCNGFLDSGTSDPLNWEEGETIVPGPEDQLTEKQKEAYRTDAEKLAVRYINAVDSTQTEIPQELISLLYNGFVHIVTTDHPKIQEITDSYPIHARLPGNPREIIVYGDTTAPWIDAWRNGQTATGNTEIDKLINEYTFELTEYDELKNSSQSIAVLQSDRAINGYAVGRQFEELNNIESSGPDYLMGDGSEIDFLFIGNHVRYIFEYGYGDCPSGCIHSHRWAFNVYQDGSLQYIGEEGDALE